MSIPNHVSTTEVVLLELEILLTIISIWRVGRLCQLSFYAKIRQNIIVLMKVFKYCLTQIVISCFTSFLLSAIAIEKECSFNIVLLAAGLGGVFRESDLKDSWAAD